MSQTCCSCQGFDATKGALRSSCGGCYFKPRNDWDGFSQLAQVNPEDAACHLCRAVALPF